MDKTVIKLNDLSFSSDLSSSKYHDSETILWDRSGGFGPIVFFTDLALNMVDLAIYKDSIKIAWLIEPICINSYPYQYISQNHHKFDLVLSHHSHFVSSLPNGQFYPNGMSWVAKEDWGLHPKSKDISIIASSKNYTIGHQLRHEFIAKNRQHLDVYGSGYNPIKHKIEALRDYRFSVAIENCEVEYYFTEKLLDCFLTGTIPIYWGCPKLFKFFNPDGICLLSDLDRLMKDKDAILEKSAKAVEENFELAKQYVVAEDWIHDNVLKMDRIFTTPETNPM